MFQIFKNLSWPVIVAGALLLLFYLVIDTKAENAVLKDSLKTLSDQVSQIKQVNEANTPLYQKDKQSDQQLMKDSARSDLLMKKPGLVELKINNSFNEYMENFEK